MQLLALSLIEYYFTVWGSTNLSHLNKVQKLQNFAARVALGTVSKYDHISPHLAQLEWLKLKMKYKYDICIFVFKILIGLLPNWLYDFEAVDGITRQAGNLTVGRARTLSGSRELSVKGPQLWNSLPAALRDTASLLTFKTKLKKHLLDEL